jgi:adenosylmethionine-8-amino-7-oxononanoate aminotransferase
MKHLFPFSINDPTPNIKIIKEITDYGFIDSNDKDVIDLGLGSSGCFPLGFKRHDIIENVSDRLKEMPFCQSDFTTTNISVNELSQRMYELSGGYDIIYSMSGSDSIEGAIKLAKMYNPERKNILGFSNSYHGSTYMSASVSGSTYLTDTFGKHPDCKILNDLTDINDSTLAVIIETCSWQAGLIPHSTEFWKKLRDKCTSTGTLLIIDDIAFCNGKTGTFFGWQVTGIKPDIFCIGKGITGGFHPLSATLMNQKVAQIIRPKVLLHGFAYSFPMSGILSALEFLKVMDNEAILENHDSVVNTMKQYVDKLVDHGLIKGYRNFGVCFNLLMNQPINDLWEKESIFYKHGLHIGVWNNYKEGILIMLPLNATRDYFDKLYEKLSNCFTELNQQN